MADPIAPITDDYIDSVIISNGPFDPNLNKTQGVPTRQLIKNLRDYLLQQIAQGGGGIPAGGTAGQILAKIDDEDYHTQWINPPAGGSQKLDINFYQTSL